MPDLLRRAAAEALGTAMLVTAVVGSGIMADRLTGDAATALLANSLATAAALVVLVTVLSPLSGAHFNPVVSLVSALTGALSRRDAAFYLVAQVAGGIAGTVLAHAMFELPLIAASATERGGTGAFIAEAVATAGLVLTIQLGLRSAPAAVPGLVGLYIGAAYWFTASTSFANPAVTIARTLTDTFAGIQPADAPVFIVAQVAGGLAGFAVASWLGRRPAV